ncbi:cupin domain-containing protein [Thermoflexus sp.]|uniref:cupin domain-containing protein n=1 Tax=Thermoflexus sp. TaxID=1969742 RepID=UPI0035E41E1E
MGVVHRRKAKLWDWEGVPVVPYTGPMGVCGSRRVLIGPRERAPYFVLRYFELPPGCKSSLDAHPYDHGVVILQGQARVLLGKETVEVQAGDVLYIPPMEVHQFENISEQPLGFLCVIPNKNLVHLSELGANLGGDANEGDPLSKS